MIAAAEWCASSVAISTACSRRALLRGVPYPQMKLNFGGWLGPGVQKTYGYSCVPGKWKASANSAVRGHWLITICLDEGARAATNAAAALISSTGVRAPAATAAVENSAPARSLPRATSVRQKRVEFRRCVEVSCRMPRGISPGLRSSSTSARDLLSGWGQGGPMEY